MSFLKNMMEKPRSEIGHGVVCGCFYYIAAVSCSLDLVRTAQLVAC